MEDPPYVTFIKMKPEEPIRIRWQDIENDNAMFDYKFSFGHLPIPIWTHMHKQLKDIYLHKERKPIEYTQGTLLVSDYTKKFGELHFLCRMSMADYIDSYREGLNHKIRQ